VHLIHLVPVNRVPAEQFKQTVSDRLVHDCIVKEGHTVQGVHLVSVSIVQSSVLYVLPLVQAEQGLHTVSAALAHFVYVNVPVEHTVQAGHIISLVGVQGAA